MFSGLEMIKLFTNEVSDYRRRHQELIRAQEGIAGKMNKREYFPTECKLNKYDPYLRNGRICNLTFNGGLYPRYQRCNNTGTQPNQSVAKFGSSSV